MHAPIRRDAALPVTALLAAGLCAALLAAGPAGAVAEAEPASGEASVEAASRGVAGESTGAEEPAGSVPRGVFTTAVVEREPTDRVDTLANDATQIYYFTELRDLDGRAVTHRWEQGGEVRAEVEFLVGGDRWRVYSSKKLDPAWLGEWTVSVVDEAGNVLRQDRFVYVAAEESAETGAEPAEAAEPAEPAEEAMDAAPGGA